MVAKARPATDCYLGVYSLSLLAFQLMEPAVRRRAARSSDLLQVPFPEIVPLTLWDTLVTGWPVFSLVAQAANPEADSDVANTSRVGGEKSPGSGRTLRVRALVRTLLSTNPSTLPTERQTDRPLAAAESLLGLAKAVLERVDWQTLLSSTAEDTGRVALREAIMAARDLVLLAEKHVPLSTVGLYSLAITQPGFFRCLADLESLFQTNLYAGYDARHELRNVSGSSAGPAMVSHAAVMKVLTAKHLSAERMGAARKVGEIRNQRAMERKSLPAKNYDDSGKIALGKGPSFLHVVIAFDKEQVQGALACVNSISRVLELPTTSPFRPRVVVHLMVLPHEFEPSRKAFERAFGASRLHLLQGPPGRDKTTTGKKAVFYQLDQGRLLLQFEVFASEDVLGGAPDSAPRFGMDVSQSDMKRKLAESPHNFVRFGIAAKFATCTDVIVLEPHDRTNGTVEVVSSCPRKVLYLDADTIVRDAAIFDELSFSGSEKDESGMPRGSAPLAVVPRPLALVHLFPRFLALPQWLPVFSAPSFNAGVLVVDVRAYAAAEVATHLSLPKAGTLRFSVGGGSQAPLLYHFALGRDALAWLPSRFNVDGLGHDCRNSLDDACAVRLRDRLRTATVLHWTGPRKPWLGSAVKMNSEGTYEATAQRVWCEAALPNTEACVV